MWQMNQKRNHDKHCHQQPFILGQAVWVLNTRDGPKWLTGEVFTKLEPVSYEVSVAGQVWKHHADKLLRQTGSIRDIRGISSYRDGHDVSIGYGISGIGSHLPQQL